MEKFFADPGAVWLLVWLKAAAIVAAIILADRLFRKTLHVHSPKIELLRSSGPIAEAIGRSVVLGLGLLILLDTFGVSITPMVASLGIGSLALALALKPTLENFFAGIQLAIDKPLQVGHFVKLESGEEGLIEQIGWRSTLLRPRQDFIVSIPNKVLLTSRITNYHYPDKPVSFWVEGGVHYAEDLENVEKVAIEVARQTLQETPGGDKTFEPFMRYHTFGDFRINFSVILRVEEYLLGRVIKHEFMRRLRERCSQEGILISLPIKAINFDQEHRFAPGATV